VRLTRQSAVDGLLEQVFDIPMGFSNPAMPWGELERKLSGRPPVVTPDGGDSPAWSRKRGAYQPPAPHQASSTTTVPYAELHCHSNFSFLDGASHPEELAEEAARLGIETVALTDHDGFYGVVRFAEAAETLGVATAFGAELSLGLAAPQNGVADPEGAHLLVLAARGGEGAPGLRPRRARRCSRRALGGAHRVPQGGGSGGAFGYDGRARYRAGCRAPRAGRPTPYRSRRRGGIARAQA
jgi:hypothetical protein